MQGMKDLDFDSLQLFARVAELGTLSAAARERNVPVSLVSRTLARIEKACGARLIHRSTHGLTLTPEGETFLDYSRRITGTLGELEAEFASKASEVSGLVRVSTSAVLAQYVLVPSLPALTARHPKLRLQLLVDDRMVDMAREGVDIAIRTGDPTSDSLVMRRLGDLTRRLYASPAYLKTHGTPQTLGDLAQHRLLSNCTHSAPNLWHFTAGRSLVAEGALQSDSTAVITAMALQGLGVAGIITPVGAPLVAQGLLVQLLAHEQDHATFPVHAAILAERHRLPKIRACIDHWRDWFSAL